MLTGDEVLHPCGPGDEWFESWWFAFHVAARRLTVYVYPWFRPNLGLYGGGVLAWDDCGAEPWTILHHDYAWSGRFAGGASLIEGDAIVTPQGVRIDCLAPAERYRIRYDHPELAFDVTFTATGPASRVDALIDDVVVHKGHIDQPGRYEGWVRVGTERLPVDCHYIRDRSWGPRGDDQRTMHVGYYHATASARDAFLAVMAGTDDPDGFTLISGYLIRDGVHEPLAAGRARVVRDADLAPQRCTIDAVDRADRHLHAEAVALNRGALPVQPGMFNWSSLAEWRFGTVTAHGELQDTWHPDKYRRFAHQRRGG